MSMICMQGPCRFNWRYAGMNAAIHRWMIGHELLHGSIYPVPRCRFIRSSASSSRGSGCNETGGM
jgi:hypothetical protein